MSTPSHTEFEARSYEIDPYGHLNNAVVVQWLEQGRLVYLKDRGLSYDAVPERHGVRVVVVRQDVVYKAQIRVGDRLRLETRVLRCGTTSFDFEHALAFPDGRPASRAEVRMVCIDAEGRSTPIPDALRRALES